MAAEIPHFGAAGTVNERTFIAVKPDGVQRGLVGEVIARFERKGYKLVALKMVHPSPAFAEEHYKDLSKKPFFPALVKYFSSGPVAAMVWEGRGVIKGGRVLVGATNPADPDSAKDEITHWFKPEEVFGYARPHDVWIYE